MHIELFFCVLSVYFLNPSKLVTFPAFLLSLPLFPIKTWKAAGISYILSTHQLGGGGLKLVHFEVCYLKLWTLISYCKWKISIPFPHPTHFLGEETVGISKWTGRFLVGCLLLKGFKVIHVLWSVSDFIS